MNRADIKNVIEKLVPDEKMEQRISEKISQKRHRRLPLRSMASMAAGLIVVVLLGIFGHNLISRQTADPGNAANSECEINVPKIELPKNTTGNADMIGLIVYQGRIYTQAYTSIKPGIAEKLLGEKLGTTKGNIDEWSSQKDYAVEFASTIGRTDVYSVKGYDKSFRIMTYKKHEGTVYAEFYECLNGIKVKTGADVFDKLKIENNINSAKQEMFESWNNHREEYKEFKGLTSLNSFVSKLGETVPYKQQSLSYLFQEQGNASQKFIYITLKDGSEVELRLFKGGFVYYSNAHIFFKMEDKAFDTLWEELL